ncbi:MAG: D-alanyl-D-alanine carboxypeptidase/D-alanyl-D-alanine endopeptidase [Thermoanaerobaculia bacterium]
MKLAGLMISFGLLLTACATAPRPVAPSFPASEIEAILTRPELAHAVWGILIEDDAGRELYARNPDVLMMPASNRKLFTAATIAACEGLDTRIATRFLVRGSVDGTLLRGDLVIVGDGDPSLAGRHFTDRARQFEPLVAALRARGITRISGNVIADVSRFGSDTLPGSWKNDNLHDPYAARADALAFNESSVALIIDRRACPDAALSPDPWFVDVGEALRCGERDAVDYASSATNRISVAGELAAVTDASLDVEFAAVQDPALYAAQGVLAILSEAGIAVDGMPAVSREAVGGTWIASIESPPLFELAAVLLKDSHNLYAEMLLKRTDRDTPSDYADALAKERLFLTGDARLDPAAFEFVDGSGLSPENLVTPRALTEIVRYMHAPERRGVFTLLLARPGEEGTLARRLPELSERLRGKTGSIDQVNALSGWVRHRSGTTRLFSVVINHHRASSRDAIRAIDDIVRIIAER